MKVSLAWGSLLLFGLSLAFWAALTAFESALLGMSDAGERIVSLLLLVLTPTIGALLGLRSLARRARPGWVALTAMSLNILFGLFHLFVLLVAG